MPTPMNQLEEHVLPLIEAALEPDAQQQDFDRLEKALTDDPSALAYYVEYMNVDAALIRRYLASDESQLLSHTEIALAEDLGWLPLSSEAGGQVSRSLSVRAVPSWLMTSVAIAGGLLLAAGIFWQTGKSDLASDDPESSIASAGGLVTDLQGQSPLGQTPHSKTMSAEAATAMASKNGVAILTKVVNAEWLAGTHSPKVGEIVSIGNLRLVSGHVQLEFYCGATLILEGPASFDLTAYDRGFFHYGKLRAHVPTRARGFRIGTESGEVIDLGTEFGLSVARDGPAELHVIAGEVDFHAGEDEITSSLSEKKQRLLTGEAMQLNQDGESELFRTDATKFVGPSQLLDLAKEHEGQGFERWQRYRDQLQKDPALVAHYTFENAHQWGRTLDNQAPLAHESSYGAIVGCDWVQGRWPMKQALQFASPSHRVRINVPGEFNSLTLATWVNVERLVAGQPIALLHPETDQRRFVHWSIDRVPNGGLLHFAETFRVTGSNEDRRHYGSEKMALHDQDAGHWAHLAVVHDAGAMLVTLYRDGKVLNQLPIEQPRLLGVGIVDLGNWPYKEWAKDTKFAVQNLTGRMDEFVIMGRAMSEREVSEMYEAGKP